MGQFAVFETDTDGLRQALGQFVTGVTIVTTAGFNREPIGITANSFSSVSLDPPLVLWSLSKVALSRKAFENAAYFCVHVLAQHQRELSERFASRGEDKFADLKWVDGPGGVPMFEEYVARFHCRTVNQFPVGDHIVFVGEVLEHDRSNLRPLVFHGGCYAMSERRATRGADEPAENGMPATGDRRRR